MSYMMSKKAYLTDAGSHNMCHLMIYAPLADAASWGADSLVRPSSSAGSFRALLNPLPCS